MANDACQYCGIEAVGQCRECYALVCPVHGVRCLLCRSVYCFACKEDHECHRHATLRELLERKTWLERN